MFHWSRLAISTLAHLGLHFGKWNLRINEQIAREVTERAERFYQRVGEALIEEGRADPRLGWVQRSPERSVQVVIFLWPV